MKILQSLSRGITGATAVVLLSIVIAVHLTTMFFYLRENHIAHQIARRDAIIQKIINAIYLVEATPMSNRAHAVSAIQDPVLHVSFSKIPKWKLQFKTISFWEISQVLRHNYDNFEISIMLMDNQWLNLNASIYSNMFLTQLLFITIEILVFGAILVAAWSINRFTRPLKSFKEAADRLGLDLNTKPIDIYGPTVVREAANAMNQMQERIQSLIRDRTQMLAAISHDLRTPITRMKLRTQMLEDNKSSENFLNDLDEMESMINETLAFAREDANNEVKTNLDLESLLFSICNEMRDMGHDVEFTSELHRVAITGRPLALKRAFVNLINNAIRYGKDVKVELKQDHKWITVTITDNGPGIAEKDLEHVFEPFYRGENSRSRDTGGVGLGLTVTHDIVAAHHGSVALKNREPSGLEATVRFPA